MEDKALAFHEAVRHGYLQMAAESARWLVIDAGQSVERIHTQILARVETLGI